MQITEEHIEWAVVDRLGQMLNGSSDQSCRVTNGFALFLATILWVKQRVGAYNSEQEWPEGLALLNESVYSPNWGLRRGRLEGKVKVRLYRIAETIEIDLANCSMWQLIAWIRNVVAHGGPQNIRPFHAMALEPKRRLIGFIFDDSGGRVCMTGSEMRMIGSRIAAIFRDTYRDRHAADRAIHLSVLEVENPDD
jgi:hypothetical protein